MCGFISKKILYVLIETRLIVPVLLTKVFDDQ